MAILQPSVRDIVIGSKTANIALLGLQARTIEMPSVLSGYN